MAQTTVKQRQIAGGLDGWIPAEETWTYASADAPTFVITVPSGAASKYSVGMRLKLTQSTVKYFIITAISDTTLTVYGGTDYTLTDAAISLNYFSMVKSPQGFPMSPAKWQVLVTSTSDVNQSTPTQNQKYNIAALGVSVPIGAWAGFYQFCLYCTRATNGIAQINITLSTANNSESTNLFTSIASCRATTDGSRTDVTQTVYREINLTTTSKTAYYTNMWTPQTNITAISLLGAATYGSTSVIKLVCAYL